MTSRFLVCALRPLALTLLTVTTLFTTHVDAQLIGLDPRLAGEDATMPGHWFGSGPLHKVRIDRSDAASLSQLLSLGAVQQVFDYESFVVAVVDEQAYGGRETLRSSGLPFRDEMDLIALNGLLLDTRRPLETLARMAPEDLFGRPGSSVMDPLAGLYLVQFAAPVQDLWRNELEELGVEILQYMPMNAYVVQAGINQVLALQGLARDEMHVQYVGAYEPGFRMTPSVRRALEGDLQASRSVTIQLIAGDDARSSVQAVSGLADEILGYKVVGPWVNVHAMVRPLAFREIASNPRVFQIEDRGVAVYHDEAQGQIVAGNLSGNSPSGPGYLSWLSSQGFTSSQFGSFSVNVVDDATSLTGHPDLASSRVAFSQNPTGQSGSQGGHGFLNAHIVSGLNSGTGSSAEDANGYNYGLGIAPWSRVGSTAIFGSGALDPTSYESSAYGLGARISTNSWSFQSGGSPIADYDSNSQEFDFITRDAQSGTSGNQEYFVIFAAGNSGSGSNTVSTPSTAKNILTVGASENVRMTGTDGCAISNSGANSADDIIGFSSRGPVNSSGGDGRWKPEIVAPGTHIQAGVPQSSYNGSSVCNQYWPSGQTLYGWSSGTSHSTPAVAGGAALVYQWFLNEGMAAPSPAMLKATLVNGGEYMTGTGAGGSLPSNSQGMGRMQLTRTLDSAPRVMVDQTNLLTSTGATYSVSGTVQSSGVPFRISLVWTDAPGPTSGAPWVNDLDLTVTVGGSTYLGNVFSGSSSVTGGSSDIRNNTESVFLPAGVSGSFTVTVEASSLAGDGVPGNGDSTDQDFALVIYNGSSGGGPTGPTANFSGTPTTGDAPLTVTFTDSSSTGVTDWDWSFGDGNTSTSQNPAHVYTAAGTYSVSLTATDADGSDTLTRTNYIVVSDPPPPSPQGIGDGSFEEQTAGASPSSPWAIDFGTGHIINPAGGASSDGGLPSEGSQWLEVSAASTNGATPPSNPGGVTSPSSGGAGTSTDFSYLSGETELSFDAAFLRNESANSNYNDWMSVDVTDGSTTVNLFYADTTTATSGTSSKYGYAMTALSTATNDLAVLFPSSTTATVFTLTVLVGNGTDAIQASLGYADNFGLASGATPTPPVANFSGTPTSGTAPLTVSFSDLSSNAPTSWSWTFGDGSSSSAQSPSHTYTAPGTYSVTLAVTNADGSDSLTRSNYITVSAVPTPPVANFSGTPTSGTAPLTVSFSDLSSNAPTSWSWTFGDGSSSSAQSPSHTYTAPGTYSVTLAVTNADGSDSLTRSNYITVSAVPTPPVANFSGTPTSGTAPLTVSFSDLSSNAPTSWSWTFGDGSSSSAQSPSHTYTAPGTYSVTLAVTNADGSDSLTRSNYITVSAVPTPPVANFSGTPTSGTTPLTVSFSDLSSNAPTSWAWTFGDGSSSSAQSPSHTYTTAGTYSVTLAVTNADGSDSLTRSNYITVSTAPTPPVANFSGTPTSGTTPLTVSFSDLSSNAPTSWSWTFGDGSSSSAQSPSHTYTTAGTYSVTLAVTNADGSDSLTRSNYITVSTAPTPPVANFSGTPTSGTTPLTVSFSDLSSNAPTSWSWTFGDGSSSSAQSPSHTYTTAGTYSVTLAVTNTDGSDSLTRSNYITVDPDTGGGGPLYYISFLTTTSVPGLGNVRDEDVVTYDSSTDTWALYFDGSDVGIGGTDINAMHVRDDGSILMSFNATSFDVPNLTGGPNGLTIEDSDLVLFTPTSTGASTSGTFSFFLDGSDIGLSNNGEDIDGVYEFSDGSLGISTLGSVFVAGPPKSRDEDVLVFDPSQTGSTTSGTWSLYFDGSDVGFSTNSGEDLSAISFDSNGDMLFSTQGSWSASGGAGDDEDVGRFTGNYGGATSGSAALVLDLSALGIIVNEDIDGLTYKP